MNLERPSGRDNRLDKKKASLRVALAAIGALQSAPANPGALSAPSQPPQYLTTHTESNPSMFDQFDQSFDKALSAKTLDAETWSRLEGLVMTERVALPSQIRFIQRAFHPDGAYTRAFEDPELSSETLSKIIKEVDLVSTRITLAYQRQEVIKGFEHLFSHMNTLQASSRVLEDTHGKATCNAFLYRDSLRDVRFETDRHCVDAINPAWKDYFTVASNADAATMIVTPNRYEQFHITDNMKLPVLDPKLTERLIAGQPVVSYSSGWDKNSEHFILKVHYSIAMPWTESVRKVTLGTDVDTRERDLKKMMFMIKPPEEGMVLARGAQGKITRVGASGSSGSIVALPGTDELRVVGSFVSVKTMEDTCERLCYSLANFNTPATHEALAQADRVRRDMNMRSSMNNDE